MKDRIGLGAALLIVVLFGIYSARVNVDFSVYYQAGAEVLRGNVNPYPEDVTRGITQQTDHYFRAAPAVAWLFVPFAMLPMPVASFVFFVLKAIGLVGIVVMVSSLVDVPPNRRWQIGLVSLAAAGGYVVEEMRYGNAHLLVLFAIVWALYLVQKGRVLTPAVLLALAIAVKLTPLLLVLYLAITKRLRVALATVAALVALLLAPALFVGFASNDVLLRGFVGSVVTIAEQPRNHALRGVIFRYVTTLVPEGPEYPRAILLDLSSGQATAVWLVVIGVLAMALLVVLRHPSQSPSVLLLKDSLVVTAMLLFSTHTQRIYFSWLFFPCCVLAALLVAHPDAPYQRPVRALLVASVVVGTILPVALPGRQLSFAYEMLSPYTFLALVFFGTLAWLVSHAATGKRQTVEADLPPSRKASADRRSLGGGD